MFHRLLHRVLPAAAFIPAPADAPEDLKVSGKYTTGRRVDAVGSVMGRSFERPTLARLATVFLHDPDKKVPHRIVHEGTAKRYPIPIPVWDDPWPS